MPGPFRVACIQTRSTDDMAANLDEAARLVRDTADAGAHLIALPEVVALIQPDRKRLVAEAFAEADHPGLACFAELARETGAWILIGSLTVATGEARVANRSLLLDADGAIAGRYDKIHMFDVDLPGGETYRESDTYRPGNATCVAATPCGALGMTVCYDLRFPALYWALAQAGADILAVPSAFTRQTGEAHWHVLLRARAIETGCYVLAPAQCGAHGGGRTTYGHTLIVDPWGKIVAERAEEGTGFVTADIDPALVVEARRALPTLAQERPFDLPGPVE